MGTKSTKSKTTKKPKRVPTPWLKLKKLWESGASYEAMAKATDAHYDPKKSDATKPTRAKISKARNDGVRIGGKLVKFGERGKVKEATMRKEHERRKTKGKSRNPQAPKTKPAQAPEIPATPTGT